MHAQWLEDAACGGKGQVGKESDTQLSPWKQKDSIARENCDTQITYKICREQWVQELGEPKRLEIHTGQLTCCA